MDGCALGIARRGETTHSGVDVNNTHPSMINPLNRSRGGTRPENWWGCAAGRWKLDPKRSRKKLNLRPKRSIFVKIGRFCTPKDSFAVGGWEKVPQKDRARSCQSEKRGSKPRHICITHHIGSTPPPPWETDPSRLDLLVQTLTLRIKYRFKRNKYLLAID